jgi:cytochrome c5
MKNKLIVYGLTILFAACASKPLVAAKLKTESKQTAPVVNANDRLSEIINPVNSTNVVSGIAEVESKENNIISGKNLYDNSCGKCHKLFDPKEFSKTEWMPILKRMQRKAHLSDIEIAEIAGYINSEI